VPFPTYLLLFAIKIHLEERLMLAEFPDEYRRYRQRIPRLIPGIRLITGPRPTSRSTAAAPGR
jgi:protein-S-isoprenylcysteine O-methyltransferase Ste14